MLFQDAYLVPGSQAIRETLEAIIYWGRADQQAFIGALIDSAATDAGNTPTTLLRPGLLMGRKTSTMTLLPWDPTAVDGTQHIFGVLCYDIQTESYGTATARFAPMVLVKGMVKAASLIIPGNASAGIDADALEILVRAALTQTGRFMLDDEYQGAPLEVNSVLIKTADYTVTEATNNAFFTTIGAVGTVNFTLPAPRVGLSYTFFNAADQTMTVTAASAGQILTDNDITGDSVSFATGGAKIGRGVRMIGISATKWAAIPIDYGSAIALTGSVAFPTTITFVAATTGTHEIILKDNQADALSILDDTGGADLMVFCTSNGSESVTCSVAMGVTGVLTATGGITIPGAVDLAFTGTTGQPKIVIPDDLADALSIKDGTGGADIIVITTTNGSEVVTITPKLVVTGGVRGKVITTPVAADGATVADAAQLVFSNVCHITSDGATKGVKLWTGVQGDSVFVINDSGTAAELYAASGGTVNGLAADASVIIPASKGLWLHCTAADTWIAFDLPAKASAS